MANYLIIGATSSIGQKTVELLKSAGHELYLTSRDHNKLTLFEANNYHSEVLDASDFVATEKVFINMLKIMGSIDGVVNCAGSLLLKPAHLTSQQEFADTIQASLTTAFSCIRAYAKHWAGNGSIVLISSAASLIGLANHEAIASAKAGINGLVISSAATYAPRIRVNAVAPGLVETSLTEKITSNVTSRNFSEKMHALARLGSTSDIAKAIIFLLENSWITGQILAIDGGLSTVRNK